MKKIQIITLLLFLSGCNSETKVAESSVPVTEETVFGARFKEGKGVELSEITRTSLGVETTPANESQNGANVPLSSVLETAEGKFVYVVNGTHFLRTEIKTGRPNKDLVEVTEGLYAGDEVVKTSVKYLWYAELQAIRGGKACADGH